jgi:flagellar biogenesis protein FliO
MWINGSATRGRGIKMAVNSEGLGEWLMARVRAWRGKSVLEQKQMSLLETLPLGGRRQLMLVTCAGERYLVGVGPDSVETIVRVSHEDVAGKGHGELCV